MLSTPNISFYQCDMAEKQRKQSYNHLRHIEINKKLLNSCNELVQTNPSTEEEKIKCQELSLELERYVTFGRIQETETTKYYVAELYNKSL
jgi:hypothetical protein